MTDYNNIALHDNIALQILLITYYNNNNNTTEKYAVKIEKTMSDFHL